MLKDLILEKLSIGYPTVSLVENLEGSFHKGKINIVLGRSGCGKSTFLKTISGFQKSLNGSLKANGEPFNPSGNISLAFQNPEMLFFNPTVGEEITYALTQKGKSAAEAEKIGKAWLERWGIEPQKFWHRHPLELSGGEKRRIALAACTVFLPPLILLDEPLAGLDVEGQKSLVQLIEEISQEHLLIVVTHEPSMMLEDAGKILLIDGSRGRWFDGGKEFIRAALEDESIYPLPEWYTAVIKEAKLESDPPWINAEAICTALKGKDE